MKNRAGEAWTGSDEAYLINAWKAERDINEVAIALGRSVNGVISRLELLGLVRNENGRIYTLIGAIRKGALDYLCK